VKEFDETDDIAAAATAIAVEQAFDRIYQQTRPAVSVQRTQSYQTPASDAPGWLPMLTDQVIQQRNLLFE
jgi:hypothetical protein